MKNKKRHDFLNTCIDDGVDRNISYLKKFITNNQWIFSNSVHFFKCMIACFFIVACSPKFDWRTIPFSNNGTNYTLTFPGKPVTAQKTVNLLNKYHFLILSGIKIETAQWVVGVVSATDAHHAQQLAEALAVDFSQKMNRNFQLEAIKTPIILKNALGAFDINYSAINPFMSNMINKNDGVVASLNNGKQHTAKARFFWTNTAAYELLSVGERDELPQDAIDTFVDSIKINK